MDNMYVIGDATNETTKFLSFKALLVIKLCHYFKNAILYFKNLA